MSFWDTFAEDESPKPWTEENATVEAVLDADDLLNDVRSDTPDLIAFLTKDENFSRLLSFVTAPVPDDASDDRKYKYPFFVAQMFALGVPSLMKTLLQDSRLTELFAVLDSEEPLQMLQSEYWGKLGVTLLNVRAAETLAFLLPRPQLLRRIVHHVDSTAVLDFYDRLLVALSEEVVDESDKRGLVKKFISADHSRWLCDAGVADYLVARLGPTSSALASANAAEAVSQSLALCAPNDSHFVLSFLAPPLISSMLNNLLAEPSAIASVEASAATLSCILRWCGKNMNGDNLAHVSAALAEFGKSAAVLERLLSALPAPTHPSHSELSVRLGGLRYKIVQLLVAAVETRWDSLHSALCSTGALAAALQLFFTLPFNNLLHIQIVELVALLLNTGEPPVRAYLFTDCSLVTRVLEAVNSAHAEWEAGKPRRPDVGCLYLILNHIARAASLNDDICAELARHPTWATEIVPLLASVNAEENRTLGQKPIATGGDSDKDWATTLKVD